MKHKSFHILNHIKSQISFCMLFIINCSYTLQSYHYQQGETSSCCFQETCGRSLQQITHGIDAYFGGLFVVRYLNACTVTQNSWKLQHQFWARTNCHSLWISVCYCRHQDSRLYEDTSVRTVTCSFQKANIKNVITKHYVINVTFLARFEVPQTVLPRILSLLWYDNESYSERLLTFRRISVPSPSELSRPRRFLHRLREASHWKLRTPPAVTQCHIPEDLHSIHSLILRQTPHNSWSDNTSWLQDDCYLASAAKSRTQECDLLAVY
jgi:hypothetical protein